MSEFSVYSLFEYSKYGTLDMCIEEVTCTFFSQRYLRHINNNNKIQLQFLF
jgi:hypothetical protein